MIADNHQVVREGIHNRQAISESQPPALDQHARRRSPQADRLELRNKEIAVHFDIRLKTVEAHRANAMRKLDLHSRIDIVRFAPSRVACEKNERSLPAAPSPAPARRRLVTKAMQKKGDLQPLRQGGIKQSLKAATMIPPE